MDINPSWVAAIGSIASVLLVLLRMRQGDLKELKADIKEVVKQTTATNGRVNGLEQTNREVVLPGLVELKEKVDLAARLEEVKAVTLAAMKPPPKRRRA
jgi:vesicle coat complex subunit